MAEGGRLSSAALLAATSSLNAAPRVSGLTLLAAYKTAKIALARATQERLLVAYVSEPQARVTQARMMVAYKTGVGGLVRSRAWTFVLDGHVFYVLNLSDEGTFAYDVATGQWSQFSTGGYGVWNMLRGLVWGAYVLGADAIAPKVWALAPDSALDEDWRPIQHAVTGGVPARSRRGVRQDNFRMVVSSGFVGENGAEMRLRFSDDNGRTWSPYLPFTLIAQDYSQEVQWLSLGALQSPGRVFEVTDTGGVIRIDDASAMFDGKDDGT